MRISPNILSIVWLGLIAACAAPPSKNVIELKRHVTETELAFAKTMTDRDHPAFTVFLADEAVFFGTQTLRGKQRIADAWKPYFEKHDAPFSWAPEHVEVLESGSLALSTGPVRDPNGKVFATFSSIWRQQAPGVWRIVFDEGNEICDCAKP
jgi:ketosteroid isomerase-like protein